MATIVRGASPVRLDAPELVRGRRVLVVEDGPTIPHGGMPHGVGFLAARRGGASAIVDPRDSAAPLIAEVYAAHPHIGRVLPAVGYGPAQRAALRDTIERSTAEVIVSATPVDLATLLRLDKPVVRARYEHAHTGEPSLAALVRAPTPPSSRLRRTFEIRTGSGAAPPGGDRAPRLWPSCPSGARQPSGATAHSARFMLYRRQTGGLRDDP